MNWKQSRTVPEFTGNVLSLYILKLKPVAHFKGSTVSVSIHCFIVWLIKKIKIHHCLPKPELTFKELVLYFYQSLFFFYCSSLSLQPHGEAGCVYCLTSHVAVLRHRPTATLTHIHIQAQVSQSPQLTRPARRGGSTRLRPVRTSQHGVWTGSCRGARSPLKSQNWISLKYL